MKKTLKQKLVLASAIILLLSLTAVILFVPFGREYFRDGGTVAYIALAYTKVEWNRFLGDGRVYKNTCIYWYPENQKSLDELWDERP